jgi:NTE family protein
VRATLDAFYGQRVQRLATGTDEVSNRLARGDFRINAAFPLTDKDFINVAARAGAFNRDEPSFLNAFLLGGLLNLSGLRDGQLAGSYLGFGRIVYFHQLATAPLIGGAIYAGGSLEAGNVWQQRADVGANDLVKAGSVFLAADTFLGPVSVAYGRASGGASSFYLFLGRPQ